MKCPHIKQAYVTDYERDKVYEGWPMCDLVDKPCLLESGLKCEEWEEIQKEWESEAQED